MSRKLTETVTVEREITGVIRDLVIFVHYLRATGLDMNTATDAALVEAARAFWDREHGE